MLKLDTYLTVCYMTPFEITAYDRLPVQTRLIYRMVLLINYAYIHTELIISLAMHKTINKALVLLCLLCSSNVRCDVITTTILLN